MSWCGAGGGAAPRRGGREHGLRGGVGELDRWSGWRGDGRVGLATATVGGEDEARWRHGSSTGAEQGGGDRVPWATELVVTRSPEAGAHWGVYKVARRGGQKRERGV